MNIKMHSRCEVSEAPRLAVPSRWTWQHLTDPPSANKWRQQCPPSYCSHNTPPVIFSRLTPPWRCLARAQRWTLSLKGTWGGQTQPTIHCQLICPLKLPLWVQTCRLRQSISLLWRPLPPDVSRFCEDSTTGYTQPPWLFHLIHSEPPAPHSS